MIDVQNPQGYGPGKMTTVTVTTDSGQTTIPEPLREKLGIVAGTFLAWESQGDALIVRRAGQLAKGQAILARLKGAWTDKVDGEALLRQTRPD